jgi:hypothetical protein
MNMYFEIKGNCSGAMVEIFGEVAARGLYSRVFRVYLSIEEGSAL